MLGRVPIAPATPPSLTQAQPAQSRLAWLDALRGIGAIAVVGEHMTPWFLPALRPFWFNLGVYGIMVFFLVSGYIIPTSLERHGDVRKFWISRIFRLYPLYLAVIAIALALSWWVPVRPAVQRDGSAIAAHATMLLDVVSVGGIVDTMWTLSYEMVFYLLVTALFTARWHTRSGLLAMLFSAGAIAAGVLLSAAPLMGAWLSYVSATVFFAGLVCVISGRFRASAACALGLMGIVLLTFGSRVPWLGLAVLGAMFAGTAIHRWERGTGGLWPVAATALLVALSPVWAIQAGWWWVQPGVWFTTLAMVAVTFAGAMVLRRRRVPRVLTWLGLISYSVYLVHHPVLKYTNELLGDQRAAPLPLQLVESAGLLVVVLLLSMLTYRFIEKPMQALGRRMSRTPVATGG